MLNEVNSKDLPPFTGKFFYSDYRMNDKSGYHIVDSMYGSAY
jgi:hypothetical protein